MQRIRYSLFAALVFVAALSACSGQPTQVQPTQVTESTRAVTPGELPGTETDVPRVSVEEAKAALDSGLAIIVDVRQPNNYESSHIAGAISVPLLQIERDLTSLTLNKEQWIITYCT